MITTRSPADAARRSCSYILRAAYKDSLGCHIQFFITFTVAHLSISTSAASRSFVFCCLFFDRPYTLFSMWSPSLYSSSLVLLLFAPIAHATMACDKGRWATQPGIALDLRFRANKSNGKVGPDDCTPGVFYDPWSDEAAPKVRLMGDST